MNNSHRRRAFSKVTKANPKSKLEDVQSKSSPRQSRPNNVKINSSFASENPYEQSEEVKLKVKIKLLVDKGRALGLDPREIRAYLDPTTCPRLFTRSIPMFHIYRAHFCTLWRRGLLWSALLSILSASPLNWRLRIQLPLLLSVLLIGCRVVVALWPSILEDECLIESGPVLDELVRPLFPCDICRNLTAVPEVINITREQFVLSYGYSGLPVLVKVAARHWKALDNFR